MKIIKTFIYSLKRSLFDTKYYKDILKTSFWFSFKYLLFLFFIIALFRSIFFIGEYLKSRPYIQPEIDKVIMVANNIYPKELELKIRNGQLSTNVKEPYIFDINKEQWGDKKHFIIIDTQGSIEDYPEYSAYVVATKNALVYPSKTTGDKITQTSIVYFKDFQRDFTLNKKIYDNIINIVKPYAYKAIFFIDWLVTIFIFFFLIFAPFIGVLSTFIGLVFLTFFVWLINLIFKKGYQYGELFRMGIHASTAPILLVEIVKIFKLPLRGFYSLIFLIWIIIIIFSNSTKTANKKKK